VSGEDEEHFRSGLSREYPAKNSEDFVVLYSGQDLRLIAKGYLDATDAIVNFLDVKRRMGAPDDALTLPLLGLCVNAIEFSLKFFIDCYDTHRLKSGCSAVRTPPADFQKVLRTHDLRDLFSVAQALSPIQGLHHVPELSECGAVIADLTNFGVSSESTRYGRSSSGVTYPLHLGQTYLYPLQLRRAANKVCQTLLLSATNDSMQLCGTGEFKRGRLRELREAAGELETLREEMISLPDGQEKHPTRAALARKVEDMNDRSLALVTMALYFSRPPACVENLEYFENFTRERLIAKILERAHLWKEANTGLMAQIQEVDDRIAERLNP
jgi:hypothetical protein